MPDLISLSCPSCGGLLQITEDIDRFACAHCGTEQLVRRAGGVVSLKPIVECISQVRIGVDKTAAELAIRRLTEENGALELQRSQIAATYKGTKWSENFYRLGVRAVLGLSSILLLVSLFSSGGWDVVTRTCAAGGAVVVLALYLDFNASRVQSKRLAKVDA